MRCEGYGSKYQFEHTTRVVEIHHKYHHKKHHKSVKILIEIYHILLLKNTTKNTTTSGDFHHIGFSQWQVERRGKVDGGGGGADFGVRSKP